MNSIPRLVGRFSVFKLAREIIILGIVNSIVWVQMTTTRAGVFLH